MDKLTSKKKAVRSRSLSFFLKFQVVFVVLVVFCLPGKEAKGQNPDSILNMIQDFGQFLLYRNHDTNYISNFGDKVSVRLVSVSKFNYFRIRDQKNDAKIRYRPARDLSVGAGVSYKWFSLDITFSLGLRKNAGLEKSRAFDFQGKIFSSKQYLSGTLQYYQGFVLKGLNGVPGSLQEDSDKREDIRTINLSLQYLYALNYTRFSMKAPFELNEVQRKSAGSVIFGATFSMFVMDADSSVIPPEVAISFDPKAEVIDMNILTLTLNAGYMYSFVYREHFFLTLSAIPGLSFTGGDYLAEKRTFVPPEPNIRLLTMNAMGYNGDKFFTGISLIAEIQFTRLEKEVATDIGSGRAGIFVGYRF